MLRDDYDVLIVGGGPAGASAAVRAVSEGARVLVVDKATFPRDKPCGDAITPRGLYWLSQLGVNENALGGHAVRRIAIQFDHSMALAEWPSDRVGLPDHGLVVGRRDLDAHLIQHAVSRGVEVAQQTRVSRPLQERGRVVGVVACHASGETVIRSPIVIAADGMASRTARLSGMAEARSSPIAVTVRAQVSASCDNDDILRVYPSLRHRGRLLAGYGWAFPMGQGCLNVGVGYLLGRRSRSISISDLFDGFLSALPGEWNLPSGRELRRRRAVQGWKLPMGLTRWPPWKPGLLAAGDAVGAAKPFTGAGISKALESGFYAGAAAVDALGNSDPDHLDGYETSIADAWATYYRLGRGFLATLEHPKLMELLVRGAISVQALRVPMTRLLSNTYRQDGGDAADAAIRLLHQAARRLPTRQHGNEYDEAAAGALRDR